MTYLVYEGISYWESTFISDDSDAVEWLKAEFTNLRSAKQYVKLWAYAKKARLYCNGMLAQIEYNEHPERMWEEDVQELTREWCRIEKKE